MLTMMIWTCLQGAICKRDLCSWPRTWSFARNLFQGSQVIDDDDDNDDCKLEEDDEDWNHEDDDDGDV